MIVEKTRQLYNGWAALLAIIILSIVGLIGIYYAGYQLSRNDGGVVLMVFSSLEIIVVSICYGGFFTLEPNQAMALILLGKYTGTSKEAGFKWANPFYTKKKISLRIRNFDGEKLKVNDKKGNPIEISAVVVWHVDDTAKAIFDVDHYENYVHVQAESALRHLGSAYAYDDTEGEEVTLRTSLDEVSEALKVEIQDRVKAAGVIINEARINHLAYAPEIAHAMLQRQQAEAIIAARQKIVDGAVGMVQMALTKLKQEGVLDLDEERKAAMVGNLMVVLCADKSTTPIINAGTLY